MDLKSLQKIPPWDWPPETAKSLRKALTDRQASPSDRLIAAQMAGDVPISESMFEEIQETLQKLYNGKNATQETKRSLERR